MEQFLSRHAGNVIATLSGFDRLVFRGTLRMLAHRGGMMSYLWAVRVLLKDFAAHAEARSGVHETGASPCPEIGVMRTLAEPSGMTGERVKYLAEPRTQRSIVDGRAHLQQQVRTSRGPAHLPRLVHASIDKEIGGAFGDRTPHSLTGTIPPGAIDEPVTLAAEKVVVDIV